MNIVASLSWLSCSILSGTCNYSSNISQATNFFISKLSTDVYQFQMISNPKYYLRNSRGSITISSSSSDPSFQWTQSLTICPLANNQFYFNLAGIQISTV